MNKHEIQAKAYQLIEDAGIFGVYPVPIADLANALGYQVRESKQEENFSGLIDYAQKVILVNQSNSQKRKRFTIAHEIGHAILHRAQAAENGRLVDYRTTMYDFTNPIEVEANHFAACILMPEQRFRDVVTVFQKDMERVAAYFDVSMQSAQVRAASLGL